MRDIANATLSGNLTRDVEHKTLPSGTDVARLRVATTTRRKAGEEWVEKTNYFTVEVYGAQARACAQYLRQGLARRRRRRARLARMDRPAGQQARGGHLPRPAGAVRGRPARPPRPRPASRTGRPANRTSPRPSRSASRAAPAAPRRAPRTSRSEAPPVPNPNPR